MSLAARAKAPFLRRVHLQDQTDPETEEPTDETAETVAGFDVDEFPAWYQDNLKEEPDVDNEAESDAREGDDDSSVDAGAYVFDLEAVKTLEDLKFGQVTVLAGDNGSGKSTIVEALAIAAGFNPEGGSRNLMFATHDTHSPLADSLTLEWSSRPKWGWFLRAETFYGMASHIAEDEWLAPSFPDFHARSHGESFLELAAHRFTGKGLYLFDEPESALSIQGQAALLSIMADSLSKGSQCIIATHSPIFMAIPGAAVYEVSKEQGLTPTNFDDLASTVLWRRFFTDPDQFFHHAADDKDGNGHT